MHSIPVLAQLPSGYFVEESPRGILAVHSDIARGMHEAGFGPEHDGETLVSDLAGRKPLREFVLDGERFVVRRFHHGGLLRWLTNDCFFDPQRPFRELILADALRKSGVPTPEVVAARARKRSGPGWTLDLITRRVGDCVDFGAFLDELGKGSVEPRERREILSAAGVLVRDMHRVGFLHADLQPKNLLVSRSERGGPKIWVLDLDGSAFLRDLPRGDRRRNLRRLFRGVRKFEGEPRVLARTDFARFLLGYRPEGGSWKEDWRSIQAAHGRTGPAHATGWWLERLFGSRHRIPRNLEAPPAQ